MKIIKIGIEGINLIKQFEGCKLKSYLCPAKIWTIGYGNTFYENGIKVKEGDTITQQRAEELLKFILIQFEQYVDSYTRDDVTQNQFSSLTSFCYNVGPQNLKSSTLLKKININPQDPTIALEFAKWNKGGGKILSGLVRRREAEKNLYFKQ